MRIEIEVPLKIQIHYSKLQALHDGLVLIRDAMDDDDKEKNDPDFMLNQLIAQFDEKINYLKTRRAIINDEERQRAEEKEIKDRLRNLAMPSVFAEEEEMQSNFAIDSDKQEGQTN